MVQINRRHLLAGCLSLVPIAGCLDRGSSTTIDIVENEFDGNVDVDTEGIETSEASDGGERIRALVTITNISDAVCIVQVGGAFYADDDRLLAEDPPIRSGRELDPGDAHSFTPTMEGNADDLARVELRIVEREDGIPPN
ncbi:hypothetical protein [Natronosalvus rutilus]|uniref:Uncharacterized protein n=1 Tax=Natronosalvus rutilus TaxID=2953753 RepID=A0A9E7SWN4_9EURY|nr:hypothetical protein [Natronosalvus rutilus]UTF54236.1 hypothetical protein NGM29_02815 [Natronosalvus rutilus]